MSGYLRSRRLDAAAVALVLLTVAGWWAARWLASRPYFDGPSARVPVVVVAPFVAAVLISLGLAGSDPELERTLPRLSATWRFGHGCVVMVTTVMVLALCATASPLHFGSWALARNVIGFGGLVLLACSLLPATLSWAPTLGYAFVIYLVAPHQVTPSSVWWAWPMTDGRLDPSWVVASTLGIIGLSAYAVRGPTLTR